MAIVSKRCWSGLTCALQTLPAASWKMLSWSRQENISLDFAIVKEATGIFVETCRSGAAGAPGDSAAKETELMELGGRRSWPRGTVQEKAVEHVPAPA